MLHASRSPADVRFPRLRQGAREAADLLRMQQDTVLLDRLPEEGEFRTILTASRTVRQAGAVEGSELVRGRGRRAELNMYELPRHQPADLTTPSSRLLRVENSTGKTTASHVKRTSPERSDTSP